MIIRRNAMHDTDNRPGQVVFHPPKTLGEIIDRVRRSEPLDSTYERGYAEGFIDGKKQGFQEGIAWMRGK